MDAEVFENHWPASRLLAALLAAMALVCLVPDAALAQDEESSTPEHLRVIWHEDPAHEAIVAWTTRAETEENVVLVDVEPRDGDVEAYQYRFESSLDRRYVSGAPWTHHVNLENLRPAATYYISVMSDGEVSEEFHFRTAPDDDRPIKILYGGDSRSNHESRRGMNRRMRTMLEEDPEIVALAHGGDYIENDFEWEQWDKWLADWQLTTTESGRMLPIIPARGNHEFLGKVYNVVFGYPGGGALQNYWVTRLGAQVALVNLNSNISHGGVQRDWLEENLERLTGGEARWIVANYHRPAYPAYKSPGDAFVHWVPLFEKYNVDLVCESDGHTLKRTVPIRDGQMADDGIVYVGEGGLGVNQRTPKTDRWYLQSPGMAKSAHHVQLLTFGRDELHYEALLMDGTVDDEVSFEPRREPISVPLELEGARALDANRVELDFSKGLDPESIGDPASYTFEPAIQIEEIRMAKPGDDRVIVETAGLASEVTYTVRVEGVRDLLGGELATSSAMFSYEMGDTVAPDDEGPTSGPTTPPEDTAEQGSCSLVGLEGAAAPAALVLLVVLGGLVLAWRRRDR